MVIGPSLHKLARRGLAFRPNIKRRGVLAQHGLADSRIDVFAILVCEMREPGLMVDAAALEGHIVRAEASALDQHLAGALHAVAQPDSLNTHAIRGPAVHSHRVGVLQHQRIGAQDLHVADDCGQRRNAAQTAEYTPWPQSIAHALIDAIAARDLDIVFVGLDPADLEGHDHVVGVLQRLTAVGGNLHLRRQLVCRDHALDALGRAFDVFGAGVVEDQCGGLKFGER
ncbi:MAG: hypothetical protein JW394_0883 [Nitrospira sp.]|nr:hypothetical protein [Nitrospira sp.]